jgi:hypothetical protein
MNEDLAQLDAELKGLFMESDIDGMSDLLKEQPTSVIKELSDYNWNIIKKYYEAENYELLFKHFKFVAFSCYIVEFAHQSGIISDEAFQIMMLVYNDIYELKRGQ